MSQAGEALYDVLHQYFSEATQLLGAITSSLNVEDEAEAPPTAGDKVAKAHVCYLLVLF